MLDSARSSTVGANTAGTITFTLGSAVASGNSIVLTFPAGWTVFNGAMTTGNWTGLDGAPASVTGNAAARTVTIVIGATAQTTLAETITITGSTQLVNPTTPAVGISIGISATGQTAGTSNVFNIVAGAPAQYTLNGPAAVNAGVASTNFTITIQDAFGNTTNTTQNTTFTLSSTAAETVTFNPVSPVTVTNGTSTVTFTYTATQAGSKTITATRASGDSVGGPKTANITVNAGAAAKLQLLVPGESASAGSVTGKTGTPSAQTTGTAFTVTVNMVDANWNVVTSTDTVGITSTDGAATLPANAALVAGTKTFNVTLNTAGTPTVTATDITNGAMTASVSPAITVAAPPPPPDEGDGGGGGPPIVIPVSCGQNQVSDGNGGCVCVAGYTMVGINCVPSAPKLVALSLMPTQAGFTPISVPVVDGQTTYEVDVVAYDAAARGPRYTIAATMSDSAAQVKVLAFGVQWDPAGIAAHSGESITFTATGSGGTSPTYTVRLVAAQPRPKLTALALVPLTASGTWDTNVPFSDWPRADLTGGQTTFTLTVTAGRSYGVAAEADSGTITYRRNGIAFDASTTQLRAGDTITVQAVNSAGTSPTYTLTLAGPVAQLTNAAVTLSSNAPAATGVTTTVTVNTPVAIPTGGKIKVTLTGFTWPATPTAAFTSGQGTATVSSAAFASNILTVTTATSAIPAGTVTLTVTGATLPAAQAAKTDVAMSVTTSADVVLASTSSGTLVAIGARQMPDATVTMSSTAPNATNVTHYIEFWSPVDFNPSSGPAPDVRVSVTLPGVTWPGAQCTRTQIRAGTCPPGPEARLRTVTGPTVGLTPSFSGSTVTAEIPDGTAKVWRIGSRRLADQTEIVQYRLEVLGGTNPAAQAARTDVAVRLTNRTGTALASSNGTMPAITAPERTLAFYGGYSTSATAATVLASQPAVAVYSGTAIDTTATGLITLTKKSGPGDLTATPATLRDGIATFTDVKFSEPGTYVLTARATSPGISSAVDTATITVVAAGKPRLEFSSQPSDSNTGTADISVQVRVLNADGTVNTGFTGKVALAVDGPGVLHGFGSVTATNGVATFSRTWNAPSEGPWVLEASARGYEGITSNSFRVTKPPYLQFRTQPGGCVAATACTIQPVVSAHLADGFTDTLFSGTVTLTLKADTANGATLATGTVSVDGFVNWTGVSIDRAGTGYVLVASSPGYADVASEAFDVSGVATKIVITQYPAAFVVGRTANIEVRAEARDAADRIVPGAASTLGLLLNNDTAPATERFATTPTRVEDGVAVFVTSYRFNSAGQYRWGVDAPGNSSLTQADTEVFTVAKPAAKLAFVQQPGGFGSVLGTQPVVEVQDEDGLRIPGATNEVRLTVVTGLADWSLTGSTVTASAGQAKFTGVGLKSLLGRTSASGETFRLTAAATGLTSATSDSFGPAGPTAKLAFTSSLPCGLVANPGCSPAAKAGQQFTITVAAQDASGQVNSNENGLVTLTSDGTSGMTARNAPFVSGVATFAGVVFTSASTTGFTLTATSGALTVSSGRIVVTADNTPASLRFIAVPTHEASGVAFVTDPQVEVLNAAGQRITTATGTVALSLHKQDGTTTSALLWDSGTTTSQALTLGTARFPGLRVTGASTGLYLKATLGTLEANQTGTIRVHADAASATMARVSEQSQSSPLSLTLNIDKALPGSLASNAVKNDVCKSLLLPPANCGVQVTVTSAALTAAVVVTDESGQVLAITQMAAPADEETVTVGPVNRRAFEAETGATAPAGTSVLYTVGRIATDAFGNRLAVLRKPQRFSLPVPESVLLPGALPGDLKVAWWDGARWTVVPSATAVNEDGSYTVTANTDALGVFAVLYAPGAGRVQGFGGFSTQSENGDAAVGLGIFAGGSTTALAHAVGLSGADGVWVQDAGGEFRLLLANGPAFVSAEFHRVFADGLAPNTIVLLVRAPRA